MHQIRFRLEPRWQLTSLPRCLSGFKGPTYKGRKGTKHGGKGEGWDRGVEGREKEGEKGRGHESN